jgi:hypothetical protein
LSSRSLPDVILKPAGELTIEVRGTSGEPEVGARVLVRGFVAATPTERHIVTSEYEVGAGGTVKVSPHLGVFQVRASSDGQLSPIWQGTEAAADGRVLLEISRAFTVAGEVSGTPDEVQGGFEVSVRWVGDPWDALLARTTVSTDGTYLCGEIPWRGPGEYVVRLTGPKVSAMEQRVRIDGPDRAERVDFTCRTGIAFTVLTEHEGKPVPGVRVIPIWRESLNRILAPGRLTDEQGLASFEGIPPGALGIQVIKDGFVDTVFGPLDIVESVEEPISLELTVAGSLRGRVTLEDGFPPDFTVAVWDDSGEHFTTRFQTSDGTFAIDRVPLGAIFVSAFTDDMPPCPATEVLAEVGKEAWVELEVGGARAVSGKVLDVSTGLPIAGARVAVWASTNQGNPIEAWGVPNWTGADGRFSNLAVPLELGAVRVRAEGYEQTYVYLKPPKASTPEIQDLGVIGLAKLQDLEVRLLAGGDVDLTEYKVRLKTSVNFPAQAFPPEGRLVIEGVDSGTGQINVFPPDGSRIDMLLNLVAGQDWLFEIPVSTEQAATVVVRTTPGFELPEDLWALGAFRSSNGPVYQAFSSVDDGGRAAFDLAYGERATFELITSAGERLASRSVVLRKGVPTRVEFELSGRSVSFRIVDGDGELLRNTFVSTWMTGDPTGFHWNFWSDEEGEFQVGEVGGGQLSVLAQVKGVASREHLVDLAASQEGDPPIVVRIDSDSQVRMLLREDQIPAANVRVGVYPYGHSNLSMQRTSDPGGELLYEGLEQGAYQANVGGNGWWPMTFDVEASPNPAPHVVQVRRRGSLELRATAGGLPILGARFQLSSTQEGDDPGAWAAAKLIQVEPVDWVTGTDGRVTVMGLPAGPYTWTVMTPGGGGQQGNVVVVGATVTEVAASM